MNFSWNLFNVGIAGIGHIIVNKDSKKPWDMKTLYDKKKKAEKSIIINMGLDLAYMVTGLLLKNNSKYVTTFKLMSTINHSPLEPC